MINLEFKPCLPTLKFNFFYQRAICCLKEKILKTEQNGHNKHQQLDSCQNALDKIQIKEDNANSKEY